MIKRRIFLLLFTLFASICAYCDKETNGKKTFIVENEKDTPLAVNVLDTLNVLVNTPIIPAIWRYTISDSTIIEEINYISTPIDTGNYKQKWIFLMKRAGNTMLTYNLIRSDSSLIKKFEINLQISP